MRVSYGLNREQYAHVLSTFSHRSYPKAPELCLAKFDELKRIGLEALDFIGNRRFSGYPGVLAGFWVWRGRHADL